MEVGVTGHNFESWPPKDHSCHVYFKLTYWFQRRRLLIIFSIGSYVKIKLSHGGHLEFCGKCHLSNEYETIMENVTWHKWIWNHYGKCHMTQMDIKPVENVTWHKWIWNHSGKCHMTNEYETIMENVTWHKWIWNHYGECHMTQMDMKPFWWC